MLEGVVAGPGRVAVGAAKVLGTHEQNKTYPSAERRLCIIRPLHILHPRFPSHKDYAKKTNCGHGIYSENEPENTPTRTEAGGILWTRLCPRRRVHVHVVHFFWGDQKKALIPLALVVFPGLYQTCTMIPSSIRRAAASCISDARNVGARNFRFFGANHPMAVSLSEKIHACFSPSSLLFDSPPVFIPSP